MEYFRKALYTDEQREILASIKINQPTTYINGMEINKNSPSLQRIKEREQQESERMGYTKPDKQLGNYERTLKQKQNKINYIKQKNSRAASCGRSLRGGQKGL